jgi:hypothetical protein
MTPEERQLISDLFDRMRSYGAPEKDREAEDLINRSVRANPDAPYLLVQSVLVQEQALQQSDERIRELEARVRDLEGGTPQRSSGSFLGGSSPWGRSERAAGSSVPTIGSRAAPPAYEAQRPWSQQPAAQPPMQQSSGGGFMRTALSAAAGVAGGMLLADGIRNMLGGGSQAHASSGFGSGGSSQPGSGDSDAGYSRDHGFTDASDNDPGASYDDGNDPGYDGGGEMDI